MKTRTLMLAVTLGSTVALAEPPKAEAAKPTPAPAPAAKEAPKLEPLKASSSSLTVSEGLATPESVYFDAESDTYLVSNINGQPLTKDNNGYVMELAPDGKVVAAKLVEGGKKGVTLNAPKGLVVSGGLLWVADIDTVRLFDRKTGAPKGEVKVPGSSFLNDLALGAGGVLYLTDSGLKAGKEGFEPTGSDGLYAIETAGKKPVLKTLLKSKALNKPNGVLATKDTLYVVTFGAAELQSYDLTGKKKAEPVKLPKGSLDGIVQLGEDFFISSWDGKAIYRGKASGPFVEAFTDLPAPADIGLDTKRSRLLVPRFMDNKVEALDVR